MSIEEKVLDVACKNIHRLPIIGEKIKNKDNMKRAFDNCQNEIINLRSKISSLPSIMQGISVDVVNPKRKAEEYYASTEKILESISNGIYSLEDLGTKKSKRYIDQIFTKLDEVKEYTSEICQGQGKYNPYIGHIFTHIDTINGTKIVNICDGEILIANIRDCEKIHEGIGLIKKELESICSQTSKLAETVLDKTKHSLALNEFSTQLHKCTENICEQRRIIAKYWQNSEDYFYSLYRENKRDECDKFLDEAYCETFNWGDIADLGPMLKKTFNKLNVWLNREESLDESIDQAVKEFNACLFIGLSILASKDIMSTKMGRPTALDVVSKNMQEIYSLPETKNI